MLERLTAALADRYRIERELGQGGMATVYLAQDLRHGRRVALKILRPELAAVIGADVDIWIKELDRGPLSRLTFGGRRYGTTSWSPDGRTVFYLDIGKVLSKRADGTGPVAEPFKAGSPAWGAAELSPDGLRFVLRSMAPRNICTQLSIGFIAQHVASDNYLFCDQFGAKKSARTPPRLTRSRRPGPRTNW